MSSTVLAIADEPSDWSDRHQAMVDALAAVGIFRRNPSPGQLKVVVGTTDSDGVPTGVAVVGLATIESA
jgi:hypothetical protein